MSALPAFKCPDCGKSPAPVTLTGKGNRICGYPCCKTWAPSDDHLYLAPAPQPPSPASSGPTPSQNPPPAAPGGPTAPQTGPLPANPTPPPGIPPTQNTTPAAPASPSPVSVTSPGQPTSPTKDLREQARRWRQENPKVYDLFVRLALKYHEEGRRRIGIKWLSEKVRFEYAFQYKEEFKINNNITTYFARMLVEDHPQLKQLFEFRGVKY